MLPNVGERGGGRRKLKIPASLWQKVFFGKDLTEGKVDAKQLEFKAKQSTAQHGPEKGYFLLVFPCLCLCLSPTVFLSFSRCSLFPLHSFSLFRVKCNSQLLGTCDLVWGLMPFSPTLFIRGVKKVGLCFHIADILCGYLRQISLNIRCSPPIEMPQ